jgi:hypothetical protein
VIQTGESSHNVAKNTDRTEPNVPKLSDDRDCRDLMLPDQFFSVEIIKTLATRPVRDRYF